MTEITVFNKVNQCCIQSYFDAGIPVWDPKLRPPNSLKC